MANQQLLDYVKQQLQLGVSKESVKAALLQSGWPVAEVDESLGTGSPVSPAAPAAAASPVTASPAVSSPVTTKPIGGIALNSAAASKAVKDLFQPKGEPVFKPADVSAAKSFDDISHPHHPHYWLLPAILGVVVVVLLGGLWWSYSQGAALRTELQAMTDATASSNQQTAAANTERESLRGQVTTLTASNQYLTTLAALYSVSTSTAEQPLTLTGILGGSDASAYTLTTPEKILVTVKNSKSVDVTATLKPLLGTTVTLGGTFVPGSKAMTVVEVNGAAAQAPPPPAPPAASSTSASSTTP